MLSGKNLRPVPSTESRMTGIANPQSGLAPRPPHIEPYLKNRFAGGDVEGF